MHKLTCQYINTLLFHTSKTVITYLPFVQKQLYLSSIQDLYNSEIIARKWIYSAYVSPTQSFA